MGGASLTEYPGRLYRFYPLLTPTDPPLPAPPPPSQSAWGTQTGARRGLPKRPGLHVERSSRPTLIQGGLDGIAAGRAGRGKRGPPARRGEKSHGSSDTLDTGASVGRARGGPGRRRRPGARAPSISISLRARCGQGARAVPAKRAPRPGGPRPPATRDVGVDAELLYSERLALYQQLLAAGPPTSTSFQIRRDLAGHPGRSLHRSRVLHGRPAGRAFRGDRREQHDRRASSSPCPWSPTGRALLPSGICSTSTARPCRRLARELTDTAKMIQDGGARRGRQTPSGASLPGSRLRGPEAQRARVDRLARRRGTVVDLRGAVTIANEQAIGALASPCTWVARYPPRACVIGAEEEALGVFQSGNGCSCATGPRLALANSEDSRFRRHRRRALPKGGEDGKNTGTLGGLAAPRCRVLGELRGAGFLAF